MRFDCNFDAGSCKIGQSLKYEKAIKHIEECQYKTVLKVPDGPRCNYTIVEDEKEIFKCKKCDFPSN